MKVLIVNRFFGGAQVPTGRMAEDVARLLAENGHEVTALASSGEYVGAARRFDGIRHTAEGIRKEREVKTQGTGDGGTEGVSERRCFGSSVGEGELKYRSTLRVEEVYVPKRMPRALAWLWFTWQARKRVPRMDWDVCVLMTDPPLLPLLAAKAACGGWRVASDEDSESGHQPEDRTTASPKHRTKCQVAVWLMDLYPEALAASGRITKSNPLYKWCFSKRQRALAAADLLICLGEAQKALVGKYESGKVGSSDERGKEPESDLHAANCRQPTRTAVVLPWDDRGNIALATEESLRNLALYAGNLGEAHCFEEILAAAPCLPADWMIRFAARGAKFAALKAAASGTTGQRDYGTTGPLDHGTTRQEPEAGRRTTRHRGNRTTGAKVEVTGYASEEETPGLLASARVHLITMSPGWEGIVVPSKLYGCIRTGRPVLFIGPENTDTAREIRTKDWGKVLPPGASGEEVAAAILELAARPTRAPQLQHGAAEVAALLVETFGLQDNGTTG